MTIRLLNEKQVRSVVPDLATVVALVEQAYRLDALGKAEVPTKIGVHPPYPKSLLHAMPAWIDDVRALGMKWISYFPGNLKWSLPDSTGIIILNEPDHGQPCCIMEGMYITFLRTAACAAIAARYLLTSPPKSLGLVGCGGLGLWSLRLMTAVFPSIERVLVASRSPESRKSFCAERAAEGPWIIAPVDNPLDAVRDMDVVVTSVPPGDVRPVSGEALKPGGLFIPLDLTNSWDDSVMQTADRAVADNPADFARRAKARSTADFPVLLKIDLIQDLVCGRGQKARREDRTLIAICGIASTDLVLAWEIYRRASAAGIGTEFDLNG